MSDFEQLPPAPNPAQPATPYGFLPPPPSGAPFAPPPPATSYSSPPYAPYAVADAKPPRPPVMVASLIMTVGASALIAGSFMTWFTLVGTDLNGFTDSTGGQSDGPVFVLFGVVLGGLGIAMLAARRVLAVAIVAVVVAVVAVLAAIVDLDDVNDADRFVDEFFSVGPGLWVILIGSLVALGGSIAALVKRRR